MGTLSASLADGPRALGPLADRGAFDQYASYRPGQIVVDDGVVYLNIAAIGAAPELEDTFDRRDQDGWGQSSHGETWQTSSDWASVGPPTIAGARGQFLAASATQSDAQLLGPAELRTDAEVLVRLSMQHDDGEDYPGCLLGLNATEDGSQYAWARLAVTADGTAHVSLRILSTAGDDLTSSPEVVPSISAGQDVWLRLRRIGLDYSATVWPLGVTEPSAPQATQTAAEPQPSGHVLFSNAANHDGGALSVGYLSVRPLTAATVPADDTAHWVALADALQVPQPV